MSLPHRPQLTRDNPPNQIFLSNCSVQGLCLVCQLVLFVSLQTIFANPRTTSTTLTSRDSKSETWSRERCCLRSPSLPTPVRDESSHPQSHQHRKSTSNTFVTWFCENVVKSLHLQRQTVCDVGFSVAGPAEAEEEGAEADATAGRFVRYQFTPAFLKLRTVGAT